MKDNNNLTENHLLKTKGTVVRTMQPDSVMDTYEKKPDEVPGEKLTGNITRVYYPQSTEKEKRNSKYKRLSIAFYILTLIFILGGFFLAIKLSCMLLYITDALIAKIMLVIIQRRILPMEE